MSLNIGPGLSAWITAHGATPLSDETYLTPDYGQSAVTIQIANAQGQPVRTIVGYDKASGQILEPGPGVLVAAPATTKTMYDSTTPGAIPVDAEVVAGYVDGLYRWSDADWARFPDALKMQIAVLATTNDGDVLDVEPGNATPDLAPGWVRMRQAAGLATPTIYCNLSDYPAVQAACAGLTVNYWLAHWTGVAHLEPGSVATQWTDRGPNGENYDISLCAIGWPS